MLTRTSLGAVLVGLLLVGVSCAPTAPERQTPTTTTYTEATTGLTFDYPSSWGDVRVSREIAGIDMGSRATFSFSANDRVSMTAASVDYSEGVGEGAPGYFTLREAAMQPASAAALTQRFDVITWERLEPGLIRMVHDNAYGRHGLVASYLVTDFAAYGFATIMVNTRVGDFHDIRFSTKEAADIMAEPSSVDLKAAVEAMIRSIR